MDLTEIIPKALYLVLFIMLLGIMFLFSYRRSGSVRAFLVLLMTAVFPFHIAYNDVYYPDKYTGILFIFLTVVLYYLFFNIISSKKYSWQHIIFFLLLSLMIRLRSYFLILVLVFVVYLVYRWIKEAEA